MDVDELRNRRARSFGATAAAYAEHRPDYPLDGVRWGLAPRRVRCCGCWIWRRERGS